MTYGTAIQIPEAPIGEEWSWLTDLSTSYDGTEDRIPLLRYPRRTFTGNYRFDNKDDLRRHLAMMTKRFATEFKFPLFQYQAKLKARTIVGDTVLTVNARRGDFRAGKAAFIMEGVKFEEVVIASVTETSVELAAPLTKAYSTRAFICPLVTVFTNTNASVTRQNPDHSATSSFTFIERLPTLPFVSPLNDTIVDTFDGLPVLPFVPVGSGFDGNLATGLNAMDYVGVIDLVSPWDYAKWAHNLTFKVSHLNQSYTLDLTKSFPVLRKNIDPLYPTPGTFYPATFRVGPYPTNVQLVAGNLDGTGFARPDDFLYFNGVKFDDTNAVTYPAGTVLYTLTAGHTVEMTVENTLDNESGISGSISVLQAPSFDWWQKFADLIQGSANPFLFATNRADLEVVTPCPPGGVRVTVKGDEYTQHYWGNDAFARIFIDTDGGRHYAKVTGISAVAGNDRLAFDPPLPAGAAWGSNQKVGFLLKVRNDNDKISWQHYGLWSEAKLAIRTVT